ncbi:hypothetical protein [Histidinibacterium lentulum]|uniref:Uncharacterized protein n=1 Tax=Histidinibacterium lentulum TaxID=2480588 RepID=A0A3N2QW68_9RHOB|nr:hypothetical protein [Histidinibacterium lentulum]ROT99397.1 hypothetical protein EAT49_14355 [Histidinibacterium lentulum]
MEFFTMAPVARSTLARLAPLVLGLMAVAAFASGILLQMQINARQAALGEIYLAGPPAPVSIGRFDPGRDVSPIGEARLTAALDLDAARDIGPLSEGGPTALAVPLRAGADTSDSAGLAIFVMTGPNRVTPEMLRSVPGAEASSLPLLTLNGVIRPAGQWQGALAAENLAGFAATGPVIFPFVEGRRAAILPPDYGRSTVSRQFSWLAGGLVVLALFTFAATGRAGRRAAGARSAKRKAAGTAPKTPESPAGRTARPAAAVRPARVSPTAAATASQSTAEPILVVTSGTGDDLPEVDSRRSPTRAILLGLALTFIAMAAVLAVPGLLDRFGFETPALPDMSFGSWAADRWQTALAGDVRAILVLVLGGIAVTSLVVKVVVETRRRPAIRSLH